MFPEQEEAAERHPGAMSPPPLSIGARIRELRLQTGRSLSAVARDLGISRSALSQIETGVMQPSVNRVIEIVASLGIPLSAVFSRARVRRASGHTRQGITAAEPISGVDVARSAEIRPIDLGLGVSYRRLYPRPITGIEYFESSYAPGAASSLDGEYLVHHGVEVGNITAGTLTFEFEDESIELSVGDSISFDAERPHRIVNRSESVSIAIWLTVAHDASPAAAP